MTEKRASGSFAISTSNDTPHSQHGHARRYPVGHASDASLDLTEILLIVLPILALLGALVWLLLKFVSPAPPPVITIATGGTTGGYYNFGKRYAEVLEKSSIRLNVRPTAGSIENVQLLTATQGGVDLALLQGGITDSEASPDIVSLGRVFLEPLWVFYRGDGTVDELHQLKGRRIAIGPQGSGTRHLALELLRLNEIDGSTAQLLPLGGSQGAEALLRGEADAVFLAMAPESPLIQKLVRAPSVKLMSFAQAEAYTRREPYLNKIVLPRGAFDLVRGVPDRDVTLIAPVAVLAARSDFHPALTGLMIEALRKVHGRGGLFNRVNEYPKAADPEFEVHADAARYYEAGPSFLKRFLPFWLATFIERMIIVAVPVAGLLVPIVKGVPMLYQWRIKRRLYYWYGRLKGVEARVARETSSQGLQNLRGELNHIEAAVANLAVPLHFSQDYYDLRSAIDLVRQRMIERAALTIPNMT